MDKKLSGAAAAVVGALLYGGAQLMDINERLEALEKAQPEAEAEAEPEKAPEPAEEPDKEEKTEKASEKPEKKKEPVEATKEG